MPHTRSAFTTNPIISAVISRSPTGFKRLVFLSSLIAYINNTNNPEKSFIRKMNKVLELSRGSDSGLELPVRLSRVLWGDREIYKRDIDVLTDTHASTQRKRSAAEHIARLVPEWFCYSTIENIASDIVRYFSFESNQALA